MSDCGNKTICGFHKYFYGFQEIFTSRSMVASWLTLRTHKIIYG
nr:MAG TPA: hypothetical protein [Herelleviridae sp.]